MPVEHLIQCEDIQPWLAAYALGEVSDDAEARAHLDSCPSCQRDLHEYRQVSGLLLHGVTQVTPPPELRERLIAAVTSQASEAAPAVTPKRKLPRPAAAPPMWQHRSRAFWAACAFAVLAVALIGWNITLRRQINEQTAEITFHRQSWQTMIVLLNDSTVRWSAVSGDVARGHIWATPTSQEACFVVDQLPELPTGQVYQVWLARPGEQVSGGTFNARNGDAWILIKTAEPTNDYATVFVTVEPAGGSAWPEGPHVMTGSIASTTTPTAFERQQLLSQLENTGQLSN